MSISVIFVIKNGIKNGYCFWESLLSCLPFANELIIQEGYSEDLTWDALLSFKRKYGEKIPINIYRYKWPGKSYHGEAITIATEDAIKRAKKEWTLYLQADEIYSEQTADYIKHVATLNYNSVSFPFYHFNRSWTPSKDGYKEAIRMVRRGSNVRLLGDAWSFEKIEPVAPSNLCPKPIYHLNWCFPNNNIIKDIEHYNLYTNVVEYKDKMCAASKLIGQKLPPYPLGDFNDFPELAKRFIGKAEYTLPEKL